MHMPFFDNLIHTAQAAEAAHETVERAGGLAALGVNGTLFLAQLINFSVVVFVLWRWVFRPIAAHLEDRSRKIEQSLKDAADIREQKEAVTAWKNGQIQEARREAAEIVSKAKLEADALRLEILQKAKEEQEMLLTSGRRLLEREQEVVLAEAEKRLAELVVQATEKVLREKITDAHDKKLISDAVQAVTTAAQNQ